MRIELEKIPDYIKCAEHCSRFLYRPALNDLLKAVPPGVTVMEAWHSPAATLLAQRLDKKHCWSVGYSPFNFGFSVRLSYEGFPDMGNEMLNNNWYPHSRICDGQPEVFHWLGSEGAELINFETENPETWGRAVEHKIHNKYGAKFMLNPTMIRSLLKSLGMYHGPTDKEPPELREAFLAFCRAWNVRDFSGVTDLRFQRVLTVVSAQTI